MTPFDQLAGVLEPAVRPRAAPPLATVRDAGSGLSARTVHYLSHCKGDITILLHSGYSKF